MAERGLGINTRGRRVVILAALMLTAFTGKVSSRDSFTPPECVALYPAALWFPTPDNIEAGKIASVLRIDPERVRRGMIGFAACRLSFSEKDIVDIAYQDFGEDCIVLEDLGDIHLGLPTPTEDELALVLCASDTRFDSDSWA